jgi:hypothetical protein
MRDSKIRNISGRVKIIPADQAMICHREIEKRIDTFEMLRV